MQVGSRVHTHIRHNRQVQLQRAHKTQVQRVPQSHARENQQSPPVLRARRQQARPRRSRTDSQLGAGPQACHPHEVQHLPRNICQVLEQRRATAVWRSLETFYDG